MIDNALESLLAKPYKYQVESSRVLWDARYGISAEEMGCIDGDAIVTINRGGCSRKITLRELHEKFSGKKGGWRKDVDSCIRCYYKGELRSMPVSATYYRGKKKVLKVTLSDGKSVKATPDHEFLTTDLHWVPAEKLIIGSEVLTNGQQVCSNCGATENLITHSSAKFKGICKQCMYNAAKDNRVRSSGFVRKFVPKKAVVISVVEEGETDVYDITVPLADNFVANGIIVHNCGKSMEAIICAVAHMEERADAKIIFCVPAFLKANWEREIEKFTLHVRSKTCHTSKDIPDNWNGIDALIMNYEQLEKTRHLFKKATMVVADEAHFLQSHESKRSKFFYNYVSDYKPDRVMLLTGTPIKNRVPEYYSLLRILDLNPQWNGARLAPRFHKYIPFCQYFCFEEKRNIPGRNIVDTKYVGFRNEKEFFELLKGRFVRHMAADVLELPDLSHQSIFTRSLPAPGEDTLNDELERLWASHLAGIKGEALASKKLESAIQKVPYTIQFVDQLLANDRSPVIVFTDHVAPAQLVGKKYGNRAGVITGDTPIKLRDEIVQRFQRKEIDVLAATIGTMSAGWTLTASTSAVFNDLPWVPGDFLQAIKRFHRIGQKDKCIVYNIVTTTLDQMIMETLRAKSATLDRAIQKTW